MRGNKSGGVLFFRLECEKCRVGGQAPRSYARGDTPPSVALRGRTPKGYGTVLYGTACPKQEQSLSSIFAGWPGFDVDRGGNVETNDLACIILVHVHTYTCRPAPLRAFIHLSTTIAVMRLLAKWAARVARCCMDASSTLSKLELLCRTQQQQYVRCACDRCRKGRQHFVPPHSCGLRSTEGIPRDPGICAGDPRHATGEDNLLVHEPHRFRPSQHQQSGGAG